MRRQRGGGVRALPAAVTMLAVAGCGSAVSSLSTGDPLHYLITIDQLAVSGFTVSGTAQHVDAATLAAGDTAAAAALRKDGLQSAARVEFERILDFSTANGPIDVVATVERFANDAGATSAYAAGIHQLDAASGAVPTSTGPLGDQAHAISVVRTAPGGLQAVEITVLWRVGNLLNIIVARGRYGGTRLADALVLADRQMQNEVASGG